MIYAGVDIAKMDHVIGAVDETGAEVAKPMGFKNAEAGFERCVAWLESVAESEDDVFVGMEATGHYWMACFAHLDLCQDFGHGSSRNQAAIGMASGLGAVLSKKAAMASAGTL